jgi:Mg-chelatase subunit ChlD
MNKIQQKIKKIKKQLRQTKKQVEDLKDKLKQCEQVKKKLKKQVKQQKRKVKKLQQKVKQVQQKLEKEKNVGFKIKSKVLFVVDLSGSMQGNKLNEVKAGLKMIVATMNPKHSMDILYFPGQNSNYGTYNNQLKKISRSFKYKTYRFIAGLGIYGGTPTKAAMTHALNNPGYSDVQSIILLTDGEPNGDISNVLSTINQANTRDVAINTIGVGSVFRQEDSNNDAVRFLKDLAKQNDGFYIGF